MFGKLLRLFRRRNKEEPVPSKWDKIKSLAKGKKLASQELDKQFERLRMENFSILDCIEFVVFNQRVSLKEATNIVINSSAWIDKKEEFIRYQQEMMMEFLEYASEDIESIQTTFTPEGDQLTIKLKPKEGNNQE